MVHIYPPAAELQSGLMIRPRVQDLSGPRGLPLFKPPYSQLVAFDMNVGDKLWQVPIGEGPKSHAALQGLELPDMETTKNWAAHCLPRHYCSSDRASRLIASVSTTSRQEPSYGIWTCLRSFMPHPSPTWPEASNTSCSPWGEG